MPGIDARPRRHHRGGRRGPRHGPRAPRESRSSSSASGRSARGSSSTTSTRHPRSLARAEAYPDVRQRSVWPSPSAASTTRPTRATWPALAVALFDQTRERHGLGDARARAPRVRGAPPRHRPPHLLPRPPQAHLLPRSRTATCAASTRWRSRCSPTWPAITAAGHPRRRHAGFAALPRDGRRVVRVLAGLLRVADALDRSHRQVVRGLDRHRARGHPADPRRGRRRLRARAVGRARRAGTALLEEALGVRGAASRRARRPGPRTALRVAAARGGPDGRSPRSVHARASPPPDGRAAPPPEPLRPVAVLDMGASAIRLVVAEATPGASPSGSSRRPRAGVLLGKDTFTNGRLGAATVEATLKALEGFRRIMDTYGVVRYRAVATSAVREAANRDDLPRPRAPAHRASTSRSSTAPRRTASPTWRCARRLRDHPALLDGRRPARRGRRRQRRHLVPAQGRAHPFRHLRPRARSACARTSPPGTAATSSATRLLRRHIHNVVEDIRREMPLREARHFIALGGDVRFAAAQILGERVPTDGRAAASPASAFLAFCDADRRPTTSSSSWSATACPRPRRRRWSPRSWPTASCCSRPRPRQSLVPDASLRAGLLLDIAARRGGRGHRGLPQAGAGPRGRPRREVPLRRAARAARGATSPRASSTSCAPSTASATATACCSRWRPCSTTSGSTSACAATTSTRSTCSRCPRSSACPATTWRIVSNVARYHRRAAPQKSHLPYMALDRDARVRREQAGGDPARGQRPRRRPPAEGAGRAGRCARTRAGCSRWTAPAT